MMGVNKLIVNDEVVALLAEGVGRNQPSFCSTLQRTRSPSSRRAWVEIYIYHAKSYSPAVSPSSRRAWVEICLSQASVILAGWSPSSRRAWVEINMTALFQPLAAVALLAEGVGRNVALGHYRHHQRVALLAEGVGRNHRSRPVFLSLSMSPSSRRAWVEIWRPSRFVLRRGRRPPRGGRG